MYDEKTFKSVFEAIQETEGGSEDELLLAVIAVMDQITWIGLIRKRITDPVLLNILDRIEDKRNALQWFVERAQDRRELALNSDQSGDQK